MITSKSKPLVGISSCLYGHKVRYDGKDQRNDVIINALKEHVELVPICPETGIGMGVPRPPIQLIKTGNDIRAIGVEDKNIDATDALIDYARKVLQENTALCGFIFKSRSPSCGVHDTPLFNVSGEQLGTGSGLFVQAIKALKPDLPIEDELRLQDQAMCDRFLAKIKSCHKRFNGV